MSDTTDKKGKKWKTPLLDQLKKGPWPSFVDELEKCAVTSPRSEDLLGQLEQSYRDNINHWKHGGMAGVTGYGTGITARFSAMPEKFPGCKEYHTVRVGQTQGYFYTSDVLRKLSDICDKYAGGLFDFHASSGDIQTLGSRTDELDPMFKELREIHFDLGGGGSGVRTPSCCIGPARCEWAMFDTLRACQDFVQHYQDELHRPMFNYKWKTKFSGCPNDCDCSGVRSDLSFVGVWKDNIRIDQNAVKEYAKKTNIQERVIYKCPTKCMSFNDKDGMVIDDANCVKCMHCINVMPKALSPGVVRGAQIRFGAKVTMTVGSRLGFILIPFYDIEKDKKEDYAFLTDLLDRIWEFWDENGASRERVGELIQRIGIGNFLEEIGIDPIPEMVAYPRQNPFINFEEYYTEEDDEEEEEQKE